MNEPVFTLRSELDLAEIWEYLARKSHRAADRFVETLVEHARHYARMPSLRRPRDDLRPGLRTFVFERYVVYFRAADDTIQIVRVLHGSRNVGPEMFPQNGD